MYLTKEELMDLLIKCQQLQRMAMGILDVGVDISYVKCVDLMAINLAVFKDDEDDTLEMIFHDTIYGNSKETAPRVFNEFKNTIYKYL